jgi:GTP cyclohydrolase I
MEEKINNIAQLFSQIMQELGLNMQDPSLIDTPKRVAKMYVNELCAAQTGVAEFPNLTTFPNTEDNNQMVIVGPIQFNSLCEHHFVPFVGSAYVAYIPKDSIVGLSKFSRLIQYCSAKPQVQERLTAEIAKQLIAKVGPDVAVTLKAKHLCCSIRGAKDPNSETVTSYLNGMFLSVHGVKEEFQKFIQW